MLVLFQFITRLYIKVASLATETVEGASLPLEGIDHVHGGHGLPLCVLSVGDCIPDHIFQEDLQDSPGLLVDQPRDPLNATPPGKTTDCRFGNALNVISKNLPVTLGSPLPQSLPSLATARHALAVCLPRTK